MEVLKVVLFNLTPVSDAEAREMIASIRMAPLLKGVRGQKGIDCEAVIDMIQRISKLVGDLPHIQELDLNPVMAFEDRVVVVDARMAL